MTISMQTLQDALIALFVTIGVAAAFSIAFAAVGAFAERGKTRASRVRYAAVPAQHPTQTDDVRELVLR
jgi:hypothetical protein